MPIKGLTDGDPTFPKLGDIRKGAAKTRADRPGEDLTYFRAVFPEFEEEAAAEFAACFGAEPRELSIILPFAEIERNWEAWREEYTAGALQHRCDGETCVLSREADGSISYEPRPCPGECVPTGRLKVIVPALCRLAYMEVHTTSKWDIEGLTRNLRALRALTADRREGLAGLPLVLKRRPRSVSTPRPGGKRVRQEKWLLTIEADRDWVRRKVEEMGRLALPAEPGEYVSSSDLAIRAAFPEDEIAGELMAGPEIEAAGEPESEVVPASTDGPEFPAEWRTYAQGAVEDLGYVSADAVREVLQRAGIAKVCESDGRIAFDPVEAWAVLDERASRFT